MSIRRRGGCRLSLKALATEAEAAQNATEAAEQATGLAETNARLAARKPNPNLRGGIGAGKPLVRRRGVVYSSVF